MINKRTFKIYAKKQLGLLQRKFKYFNTSVYFPKNSLIFKMACEEGIYDKDVFYFIFAFLKEDGLFIDIGTNIGLLSVPVLNNFERTQVLSFEPSKTVLPYLLRTQAESANKQKWTIYDKALGDFTGKINFNNNSDIDSAFDGVALKNDETANGAEIDITTIDELLQVSADKFSSIVIKIDVEGFEYNVLKGGKNFIAFHKPAIVIEIVKEYLNKYNISLQAFMELVNDLNYNLYGLTTQIKITNTDELDLALIRNLNFVLLPRNS